MKQYTVIDLERMMGRELDEVLEYYGVDASNPLALVEQMTKIPGMSTVIIVVEPDAAASGYGFIRRCTAEYCMGTRSLFGIEATSMTAAIAKLYIMWRQHIHQQEAVPA